MHLSTLVFLLLHGVSNLLFWSSHKQGHTVVFFPSYNLPEVVILTWMWRIINYYVGKPDTSLGQRSVISGLTRDSGCLFASILSQHSKLKFINTQLGRELLQITAAVRLINGREGKFLLLSRKFKTNLWAFLPSVNSSGSEQNPMWLEVFILQRVMLSLSLHQPFLHTTLS